MKRVVSMVGISLCCMLSVRARAAEPALTIYNQNFAVVRETIPLELKQGVNSLQFTDTTAHLEPDSVMLRDTAGKRKLQVLEQNYRADPVSEQLLLSLYEGKTIEFLVVHGDQTETVQGKIVRSAYAPHQSGMDRYGQQYSMRQSVYAYGTAGQPIIEVNGKLRFGLPGTPIFPSLADDTILKPTINWLVETDKPGKFDAELAYVTGGMSWEADYNLVAPEEGDTLDLVGWVTMDNQSGKTFENAKIKLMAGDVSKIESEEMKYRSAGPAGPASAFMNQPVSEKAFDDYHLYTLNRTTTMHDRETKQVEFIRATGVKAATVYVYDGVTIDSNQYRGWSLDSVKQNRDYGTQCNPKVWVLREFANSEANHLGMPLPKGRTRFYRRDKDGQVEFTGENTIDHTPRDETVRVYTGNAFDLTGERRRTVFYIESSQRWSDESFEIKLRNHKKEAAEIRVVEHLYRGDNWEITKKSDDFTKKDSHTIEFRAPLKPDEEKIITYTVHYTW